MVAVLGIGSVGFLYVKNQSLANENSDLHSKRVIKETAVATLKDEIANIEQEVVVWETTDLDKEAVLLRLKLDRAEKDLAAMEKKAAKFKMNLSEMKPYADALAAVDYFFSRPMTEINLNNIYVKINALHDNRITDAWMQAKAEIHVSQQSWGTREVVHTLFLIVSQIRALTS